MAARNRAWQEHARVPGLFLHRAALRVKKFESVLRIMPKKRSPLARAKLLSLTGKRTQIEAGHGAGSETNSTGKGFIMKTKKSAQLGMVGLGRMGANMVRRLIKAGHRCTVFDRIPAAVASLAKDGA